MDLDDAERYAAAALFTIALHSTQVEVGVDGAGSRTAQCSTSWGCPSEELFDDLVSAGADYPWVGVISLAVPKGFWGYDACAPKGILQSIYQALNLPERAWPGLLKMPDVSEGMTSCEHVQHLVALIRRYSSFLDPQLSFLSTSAASTTASQQRDISSKSGNNGPEDAEAPGSSSSLTATISTSSTGVPNGHEATASGSGGLSSCEGQLVPTATFTPPDNYRHESSHKSVLAIYSMMGACLAAANATAAEAEEAAATLGSADSLPCPRMDSISSSFSSSEDEGDDKSKVATKPVGNSCKTKGVEAPASSTCASAEPVPQQQSVPNMQPLQQFHRPYVRLYDARCRVALKRMCHWLRVPWSKMRAFEQLWAVQLLELDDTQRPEFKRQSKALTALKVGAGALGAGALLAVTGGLAAPAIAAGMGLAVTMVHGTAAIAGAVTAFGASATGTAAITGTFGAIGLVHAGSKTATFVGDVSEFGFWDIASSVFLDSSQGSQHDGKEGKSTAQQMEQGNDMTPGDSTKGSSSSGTSGSAHAPCAAADDKQPQPEHGPEDTPDTCGADSPQDAGSNRTRTHKDTGRDVASQGKQADSIAAGNDEQLRARRADISTTSQSQPDGVAAKDNEPSTSGPDSNGRWWSWFKGKKGPQLRPLLPLPINPRRKADATFALTIAVNGWVSGPEDFVEPWRHLPGRDCDRYALVWESQCLTALGGALSNFLRNKAIEESGKMVLRTFLLTSLVTAMMIPLAIISAVNVTIGSRWRVALKRAKAAGRMLAHVLASGHHGDRPVTLVGFSMGARVIFHCLLELSRLGQRGVVESAVLLGAPVSLDPQRWAMARSVVAGRFINAYSNKDWVLGIIYRCHSRKGFVRKAGGLFPMDLPGIENVNLSKHINGHTEYPKKMDDVLEVINLRE